METRLQRSQVCCHLETFFANCELVRKEFPHYFTQDPGQVEGGADDDESDVHIEQEEENLDDVFCQEIRDGISFNVETGLWSSNSHSQYQPKSNMFDPDLVQRTGDRSTFVRPDQLLEGGEYLGPDLIPPLPSGHCACGKEYTNENFPEGVDPQPSHKAKVYTKTVSACCGNAVVTYDVQSWQISITIRHAVVTYNYYTCSRDHMVYSRD